MAYKRTLDTDYLTIRKVFGVDPNTNMVVPDGYTLTTQGGQGEFVFAPVS